MSSEDKAQPQPVPGPTKGKDALRSRFATPMEADQPVNPDEKSRDQFTPPSPVEQDARLSEKR